MLAAPATKETFDRFLQQDLEKKLLRFSTAGSVDDGKSTLIGRLLHDAKGVYEDQLASVKKSRINRSTGPIDFSLLTDGLRAEREQGITIDVAYRYFATGRRKFIIADTPGHEQYTRNMTTGASTASLAVILVDATKGLLPQTRRHSYIASLLGIPNVLAAINKMDLIGYDEETFLRLQADFISLADRLNIAAVQCVPVSALDGDNIVDRSHKMPWYAGPTLLEHLETVPIEPASSVAAIRFPVQYVIRPDSAFRGFAGQVAGGTVRKGDSVMALPSRQSSRVQSIVTFDGELEKAALGQSVTVTLEDEIDLSRGDMLVSSGAAPAVSTRFSASLVWLDEKPLQLNHSYVVKHTTRLVRAKIVAVRHRVNVNTLDHEAAQHLELNEIGIVEIETSRPLFFDSYQLSRTTGSFILVAPLSNATIGAGMIREDLAELNTGRNLLEGQAAAFGSNAVARTERILRHGHKAAVFLVPNHDALAELAERALFDRGFEIVLLRAEQFPSLSLAALLELLWAGGFVVLLVTDAPTPETRNSIKGIAGEFLFDLSTGPQEFDREQLIAQILLQADSLRVRPSPDLAGGAR